MIYSGDLNNEQLNIGNIWITNLFVIHMPSNCSNYYFIFSSHVLNNQLLVCYSTMTRIVEPTILDHLNTELVCNSDPHCKWNIIQFQFNFSIFFSTNFSLRWCIEMKRNIHFQFLETEKNHSFRCML